MNNEEVLINDYTLKLSDGVDEIEDLEAVLDNLSSMGDKEKLKQFLLISVPFPLPYSHNIYVSNDGLVTVDIFDKDLSDPENPFSYELGIILDF
jgi:hypothetical protein